MDTLSSSPLSLKANKNTLALMGTIVFVALLLLFHTIRSNQGLSNTLVSGPSYLRNPPGHPAFSLLVLLAFQDATAKNEFLDLIQPLTNYVRDYEPDTIAYEVMQSDQDALQVILLERYADKEHAYLNIHKSSAAFLEFRPKLLELEKAGRVTISGNSYIDSDLGFVGRPPSLAKSGTL